MSLQVLEDRLRAVCDQHGKDFTTASRLAQQMAEGRLSMEQCISLVIQSIEGAAGTGVTILTALETFRGQLANMDDEERKAERRVNDCKRKRAELQKVVNALDEIVGNPGDFECPYCGKPCRNVRSRANHITRAHPEEKAKAEAEEKRLQAV